MGFNSLLDNQVQGLMRILGQNDGLAPTHTYERIDASTYDPSTGGVSTAATRYDDIPMVFARYETDEIDGDKIQVTDQKAIIAALDLPVNPRIQDRVIQSDGRVFHVENVGGVPGESVWILQMRESDV
jgi:hypothetical protein